MVGLYSRFDVIVSTGRACTAVRQRGGTSLHAGTVGTCQKAGCGGTHTPAPVPRAVATRAGTPCTRAPPLPQHLAAQKTYNNLDISVREALRQRTVCLEGVLTCYPHETMEDIIDRIAEEQVSPRAASLLPASPLPAFCPPLPTHTPTP